MYFLGLFEDVSKIFQNPNLWSIWSIFPDLARRKGQYRVPGFGGFFQLCIWGGILTTLGRFFSHHPPQFPLFAQRMGVKNVSFYWACMLLRENLSLIPINFGILVNLVNLVVLVNMVILVNLRYFW